MKKPPHFEAADIIMSINYLQTIAGVEGLVLVSNLPAYYSLPNP